LVYQKNIFKTISIDLTSKEFLIFLNLVILMF